jgi:hypothetical protein
VTLVKAVTDTASSAAAISVRNCIMKVYRKRATSTIQLTERTTTMNTNEKKDKSNHTRDHREAAIVLLLYVGSRILT